MFIFIKQLLWLWRKLMEIRLKIIFNMLKNILFLMLLFYCFYSEAQESAYIVNSVSNTSKQSRIDTNSNGDVMLVSFYDQKNIQNNSYLKMEKYYKGTPFFMNGWYKGQMEIPGSKTVAGTMAYDLVNSVIYYIADPKLNAVELRPKGFTINDISFYNFKDEIKGAGNFYYETILTTEPRLLKQYTCTYSDINSALDNGYTTSSSSFYEGEYIKKENYYLIIDGKLELVSNKKRFLKSLGNYQNRAEKIIKENKLSLKNNEDIVFFAQKLGEIMK